MPALVEKHKKQVLITKMKYTYSVINNAFIMAQKDYGDPTAWDWGVGVSYPNTERVAKTYLVPYLSLTSQGKCTSDDRGYCVHLKNGITLVIKLDGLYDIGGEDGAVATNINILASLKNKQSGLTVNIRDYSREDFVLQFTRASKKLLFFNWGGDTREAIINNSKYACNKTIVKNMRLNCGALIFYDGWQIKDDYPW